MCQQDSTDLKLTPIFPNLRTNVRQVSNLGLLSLQRWQINRKVYQFTTLRGASHS